MTVSVPVSARQATTGGQLGIQVGVIPVTLPASGSLPHPCDRNRRDHPRARGQPAAPRGALPGPPFRLLAPTRLLHWYLNRQWLVHTFATNLHGPEQPLTFAGARCRT